MQGMFEGLQTRIFSEDSHEGETHRYGLQWKRGHFDACLSIFIFVILNHKTTHHQGPISSYCAIGNPAIHICEECGKTFGRKSHLKEHRESVHKGLKWPCQYCDRVFSNRSNLNQHMKRIHNIT